MSKSGTVVAAHLTATMILDRLGRPLYGLATIEAPYRMPALSTNRTSFGTTAADSQRIRNTILM